MNNTKHPSFLIGIVAIILSVLGIGFKANGYRFGDYLIFAAIALAAISWIWSIIDVVGRGDMKPFQKRFWLIVVVAAPFIGGMLFHILHQRAGRITT